MRRRQCAVNCHREDKVPTYAYACTECDNRFDAQQSFSDSALTHCPQCEGRVRKLFNSVGIVFKGSGFYRTDSRAKAKATGGTPEKPSASESSSSESSSSESSSSESSSAGSSSSGSQSGSRSGSRSNNKVAAAPAA